MKTIILFTLMFLFNCINIFSQGIPGMINYQGVLKDNSGIIVPDGDYALTFKLYNTLTGGTESWAETKTIAVAGGIFSTLLGSVNPINVQFTEQYYLGITIASGSELTPRLQLSSVPYSLISQTVPDNSLKANKIQPGEVVKSINGINENVNIIAGANVTITPSGNNLTISSTGGSGSLWSTNGTNAFYNAGNVGIGLNTPQNLLHLHRTDPFFGSPSVLRLTNITSGAAATDGLILSLNNTVADYGLIGVLMMQENGSLGFGTNNTYQMFLKETGSLGLGTFNPQGKIDIFHNSASTNPQLMISENENGGFGRINFRSFGVDNKYWTLAARTQATDASSQFNFYYFNGTSGQDIISVNGNGNVGIGTTSPVQKLDINGNIRTSGEVDAAGNIKTNGEVNRTSTANANLVPICYGNVTTAGVINTGTGNFSVTRTSAGKYEITISGENFLFSNYIVNTNAAGTGTSTFGSIDGKLLISTYDILVSGLVSADKPFAFTVYKP